MKPAIRRHAPLARRSPSVLNHPRVRAPSANRPPMIDDELLKQKLGELRSEHRDLDNLLQHFEANAQGDQLTIQRMKKRKLVLKDLIAKLESQLVPDIIA